MYSKLISLEAVCTIIFPVHIRRRGKLMPHGRSRQDSDTVLMRVMEKARSDLFAYTMCQKSEDVSSLSSEGLVQAQNRNIVFFSGIRS